MGRIFTETAQLTDGRELIMIRRADATVAMYITDGGDFLHISPEEVHRVTEFFDKCETVAPCCE